MTVVTRDPNFIVGGTSAGGTSFLAAALVQHPEIYLPVRMRPEPHFFYKSWEYAKGHEAYLAQWFGNVPSDRIAVGERSSSYLFGGTAVAERMAAAYPDLKLIFTLRNPIERTWANYRYTVLQGLDNLSFEEALAQEQARVAAAQGIWAEIQPHNYTGRGFYGAQLSDFLAVFPSSQILVLKSELLSSDTDAQLRKVYRFLGLRDLDFAATRPSDHTSGNVIDPALQMTLRAHFGNRFDLVIEAIRKTEDPDAIASSDDDRAAIQQLRENMKGMKEAMPASTRAYLHSLFADDLRLLAPLVDFDISDWQ